MKNNQDEVRPTDQELSRKRKNNGSTTNNSSNNNNNNSEEYQISKKIQNLEEDDNDLLSLSLSVRPAKPRRAAPDEESSPLSMPPLRIQEHQQQSLPVQTLLVSQPQPQPQLPLQLSPSHPLYIPPYVAESSGIPVYRHELVPVNAPPSRPLRSRRNPTQTPGEGKSDTVPALFPWATTHRATVHSLKYLLAKRITTITGEMQCKKCEKQYEMGYDLEKKFFEVARYIAANKDCMHDRAPSVWMNPVLPTCKFCDQENSAKPVIPDKKKEINWLFLLLGQLLGCCTLDQLKYFCKHTKNHRTGAKDRVLYLTYMGLCKQLDPAGPFDR